MRAVTGPGRWVWGLSGLFTAVALAVPGIRIIDSGGQAENAQPQSTTTRTVTVPQPVTSLTVQSYGAPVEVTAGPVRHVRITETLMYDGQAVSVSAVPTRAQSASGGGPVSALPGGAQPAPGGPLSGAPAVEQSVSDGRLSLAEPACETSDCSVSFTVTVPPDVTATVATEGGPVTVSRDRRGDPGLRWRAGERHENQRAAHRHYRRRVADAGRSGRPTARGHRQRAPERPGASPPRPPRSPRVAATRCWPSPRPRIR